MSEVEARVEWYESNLVMRVLQADDLLLARLAPWVEAEFKVNARVDTGFYRNSAYSITPLTNTRGSIWPDGEYKSAKSGQAEMRRAVAETPQVGEHMAAIHVAAEYAIYREMADNTLYNAAQAARGILPELVSTVAWEHR